MLLSNLRSISGLRNKVLVSRKHPLIRTLYPVSYWTSPDVKKRSLHMSEIGVKVVRVLSDNLSYIVWNKQDLSRRAALVDPVEPEKSLAAASALGLTVKYSLTTHRHWDHAGGNEQLKKTRPDVQIFGGIADSVPFADVNLADGQVVPIDLGEGVRVTSLETPCHTRGHVLYLVESAKGRVVFTGDTLFVGGCGRFFEGSPEQMHRALISVIGNMPDDTLVYCGHEYTVSNLKFAVAVEPDNAALQEELERALRLRGEDKDTVPTTIGKEKQINPFMRVQQESVKRFAGKEDPVEVMGALRIAKNGWSGSGL